MEKLRIDPNKLLSFRNYCHRQQWFQEMLQESKPRPTQGDLTAASVRTSNLPAPTPAVDAFDDFDMGISEPVAKKARLDDSAVPSEDEGILETTWESSGAPEDGFDGYNCAMDVSEASASLDEQPIGQGVDRIVGTSDSVADVLCPRVNRSFSSMYSWITADVLRPHVNRSWRQIATALGYDKKKASTINQYCRSQPWYAALADEAKTKNGDLVSRITAETLRPLLVRNLRWNEIALHLEIPECDSMSLFYYCRSKPWFAALRTEVVNIREQGDSTAAEVGTSNLPAPAPGVDPFDDFDVGIFEPVAKKARLDDAAVPSEDEGILETTWKSSGAPEDGFDWDGSVGEQEFDFNGIGDEPAYDQWVDPSGLGDGAA